jgi:hypothetical protein
MFTVGPCPFRSYISESDRIRSGQLRVAVAAEAREQASSRHTEEYKKSARENLTSDLKTLCVL